MTYKEGIEYINKLISDSKKAIRNYKHIEFLCVLCGIKISGWKYLYNGLCINCEEKRILNIEYYQQELFQEVE